MLREYMSRSKRQRGITIIEVLVTMVIMAFGLLGLANLQGKIKVGLLESYQRSQAVILLSDMTERINANRLQAASYVSTAAFGVGDTQPADCSGLAAIAARDKCEWSNALKGAGETKAGNSVGAMTDARGCISLIQAANPVDGVCTPGIYLITVAWQGMVKTSAPAVLCASGLYGEDTYRRVISTRVSIGLPSCS